MKNEIIDIIKQTEDINQKLINEIKTSVFGFSEATDSFFRNEKEGEILLSIIYRYLTTKTANVANTCEYNNDLSLKREEGFIFTKTWSRQREVMALEEDIKRIVFDNFGIKLDRFEKTDSADIYFNKQVNFFEARKFFGTRRNLLFRLKPYFQ